VQNASITDPTLAPQGHSTIYVLVPVSNLSFPIAWEQEKERYTEKVLDALESRASLAGLRSHIKTSKITTPEDWQNSYHVYKGATFNLAHTLGQNAVFPPAQTSLSVSKTAIWSAEAPTRAVVCRNIYESGRISAEMILAKHAGRK
jgi:phytoene desaturase